MILRNQNSQDFQIFDRNVDPGPHVHSDSEPGVNAFGIYVENHHNKNLQFLRNLTTSMVASRLGDVREHEIHQKS